MAGSWWPAISSNCGAGVATTNQLRLTNAATINTITTTSGRETKTQEKSPVEDEAGIQSIPPPSSSPPPTLLKTTIAHNRNDDNRKFVNDRTALDAVSGGGSSAVRVRFGPRNRGKLLQLKIYLYELMWKLFLRASALCPHPRGVALSLCVSFYPPPLNCC